MAAGRGAAAGRAGRPAPRPAAPWPARYRPPGGLRPVGRGEQLDQPSLHHLLVRVTRRVRLQRPDAELRPAGRLGHVGQLQAAPQHQPLGPDHQRVGTGRAGPRRPAPARGSGRAPPPAAGTGRTAGSSAAPGSREPVEVEVELVRQPVAAALPAHLGRQPGLVQPAAQPRHRHVHRRRPGVPGPVVPHQRDEPLHRQRLRPASSSTPSSPRTTSARGASCARPPTSTDSDSEHADPYGSGHVSPHPRKPVDGGTLRKAR